MYKPPYIGITGFATADEVKAVLAAMPANTTHKLMCGVLASRTTLNGEAKKSFPQRYPKVQKIADIFSADERALNLIHYSSKSAGLTLANEMVELRINHGGPNCHGIQMNLAWPSARYVVDYYRRLVEHHISAAVAPRSTNEVIVLQVGRRALAECDHNPVAVASRLREYEGIVNYALIDQSGGEGKQLDAATANFVERLSLLMPKSMGLAVAGGLSALSVDGVLRQMPGVDRQKLSLDAEGRLRTLDGDAFHLPAAINYLKRALFALQQVPA